MFPTTSVDGCMKPTYGLISQSSALTGDPDKIISLTLLDYSLEFSAYIGSTTYQQIKDFSHKTFIFKLVSRHRDNSPYLRPKAEI